MEKMDFEGKEKIKDWDEQRQVVAISICSGYDKQWIEDTLGKKIPSSTLTGIRKKVYADLGTKKPWLIHWILQLAVFHGVPFHSAFETNPSLEDLNQSIKDGADLDQ